MKHLYPDIVWTADCQGKMDYDGPIIDVSTRFWPEGGGVMLVTNDGDGTGTIQDGIPGVKPAASSSIYLRAKDVDGNDRERVLAQKDFEGDTGEEVRAQVEAWVKGEFDKIVRSLVGNSWDMTTL